MRVSALVGLGMGIAFQAAPAAAWMQWYYQDIPQGAVPGFWYFQSIPDHPTWVQPNFWFYRSIPQAPTFGGPWSDPYRSPTPGQAQPFFYQYQTFPMGASTMWSSAIPMSRLFVEQSQSPAGYRIRVYSGQPLAGDVNISIEGGALIIRQSSSASTAVGSPVQTYQSGWSSQLVALPADANVAAMQMQRGNGMVEIFIPRFR
jgi:hypothetical protein